MAAPARFSASPPSSGWTIPRRSTASPSNSPSASPSGTRFAPSIHVERAPPTHPVSYGFNLPSAAPEYAVASQEAARAEQYHPSPAPAHRSPLGESPPSTLSLSLGPPTLRASNLRVRLPTRSVPDDPEDEDGLVSPKRHDVIQRKLLASEGHNFFSVASAA